MLLMKKIQASTLVDSTVTLACHIQQYWTVHQLPYALGDRWDYLPIQYYRVRLRKSHYVTVKNTMNTCINGLLKFFKMLVKSLQEIDT